MQYSIFIALIAISGALSISGCDGAQRSSGEIKSHGEDKRGAGRQNLANAGALLPENNETIDSRQAQRDEHFARQTPGDRGVFNAMHSQDGVTLRPSSSTKFSLADEAAPQAVAVAAPVPPVDGQCQERRAVCAQACATAHAQAAAFAFAHASATACAWAEAWACVFTVSPFTRVCSWARSQACATAFATAFGAGYATDTQTVCAQQCAN